MLHGDYKLGRQRRGRGGEEAEQFVRIADEGTACGWLWVCKVVLLLYSACSFLFDCMHNLREPPLLYLKYAGQILILYASPLVSERSKCHGITNNFSVQTALLVECVQVKDCR
jgi:hypothetical protein